MKNTTLLKVLSASAIFTAIAAIESYDHNAFATEITATANNTQSDVETKTVLYICKWCETKKVKNKYLIW